MRTRSRRLRRFFPTDASRRRTAAVSSSEQPAGRRPDPGRPLCDRQQRRRRNRRRGRCRDRCDGTGSRLLAGGRQRADDDPRKRLSRSVVGLFQRRGGDARSGRPVAHDRARVGRRARCGAGLRPRCERHAPTRTQRHCARCIHSPGLSGGHRARAGRPHRLRGRQLRQRRFGDRRGGTRGAAHHPGRRLSARRRRRGRPDRGQRRRPLNLRDARSAGGAAAVRTPGLRSVQVIVALRLRVIRRIGRSRDGADGSRTGRKCKRRRRRSRRDGDSPRRDARVRCTR